MLVGLETRPPDSESEVDIRFLCTSIRTEQVSEPVGIDFSKPIEISQVKVHIHRK